MVQSFARWQQFQHAILGDSIRTTIYITVAAGERGGDPKVELRTAPGLGRGVYALKDISEGELSVAHHPSRDAAVHSALPTGPRSSETVLPYSSRGSAPTALLVADCLRCT